MQRRPAIVVLRIDVGALADKPFRHLPSVPQRGIVQRRVTVVLLRVNVGALADKPFRHLPSVLPRGMVQRRPAIVVLRIDVGAAGGQRRRGRARVRQSRDHQRRLAVRFPTPPVFRGVKPGQRPLQPVAEGRAVVLQPGVRRRPRLDQRRGDRGQVQQRREVQVGPAGRLVLPARRERATDPLGENLGLFGEGARPRERPQHLQPLRMVLRRQGQPLLERRFFRPGVARQPVRPRPQVRQRGALPRRRLDPRDPRQRLRGVGLRRQADVLRHARDRPLPDVLDGLARAMLAENFLRLRQQPGEIAALQAVLRHQHPVRDGVAARQHHGPHRNGPAFPGRVRRPVPAGAGALYQETRRHLGKIDDFIDAEAGNDGIAAQERRRELEPLLVHPMEFSFQTVGRSLRPRIDSAPPGILPHPSEDLRVQFPGDVLR